MREREREREGEKERKRERGGETDREEAKVLKENTIFEHTNSGNVGSSADGLLLFISYMVT